jgi:hypothetical protein
MFVAPAHIIVQAISDPFLRTASDGPENAEENCRFVLKNAHVARNRSRWAKIDNTFKEWSEGRQESRYAFFLSISKGQRPGPEGARKFGFIPGVETPGSLRFPFGECRTAPTGLEIQLDAFPGLRFAPRWAIILSYLREELHTLPPSFFQ